MGLTPEQQIAVQALSIATNEIPSLLRKGIDLGDLFVDIFNGQIDPLNPEDGVLDVNGDLKVTGDADAKSFSMENSQNDGTGTISWLKDASIVGGAINAAVSGNGRIESGGGGFAGGIVSAENSATGYIFAEGTPQSDPASKTGFGYAGNMAFGAVGAGEYSSGDGTGYIKAHEGSGNVAFGKVQQYASSPSKCGVIASWYGGFAFGYAYSKSGTGDSIIQSAGHGNLAFGKTKSRGTGKDGNARIEADGTPGGGLAFGYCLTTDDGNAEIGMTDRGSLAFGYITNGSNRNATLQAAKGSFAGGYIIMSGTGASGTNKIVASLGGMAFGTLDTLGDGLLGLNEINATVEGSFAMGKVRSTTTDDSRIRASGTGSFAFGYAQNNETIEATVLNTAQFFPGSNGEVNSLSVGTGPRLNGDGVPGTLRDGDIWVAANYTYIRSNGVSVKIT